MNESVQSVSTHCPHCDGWGFLEVEGDGGYVAGHIECECGSDPSLRNAEEIAESVRALYDEARQARAFSLAEAAYLREPRDAVFQVVSRWERP